MELTPAQQFAIAAGSTFLWHEIYTPDPTATANFYTTCLDFGTTTMDMGPMGKYEMLEAKGTGVAGIVDISDKPSAHRQWIPYISVTDVDEKVALCLEHGAKLLEAAMDVPTVGRMALIEDPQGASV